MYKIHYLKTERDTGKEIQMTKHIIMAATFLLLLADSVSADDTKVPAPLYFREDWKEIPADGA